MHSQRYYCDVWVRHGRKDHRVICGASLDTDCSDIYHLMSEILKCQPHHFYLSNDVKVLLPGHPLKCYASSENIVHGLHLDCFLKCVGGNGSGDEGGSFAALSAVFPYC